MHGRRLSPYVQGSSPSPNVQGSSPSPHGQGGSPCWATTQEERMEMLLMISGLKRASFYLINTLDVRPFSLVGKLWTVRQTLQRPDFRAQLAEDTLEMFWRWHSWDAAYKVNNYRIQTNCVYWQQFHKVAVLVPSRAFWGCSLSAVTKDPVYLWNEPNSSHKMWNIFTKINEWKSTFGIRSA